MVNLVKTAAHALYSAHSASGQLTVAHQYKQLNADFIIRDSDYNTRRNFEAWLKSQSEEGDSIPKRVVMILGGGGDVYAAKMIVKLMESAFDEYGVRLALRAGNEPLVSAGHIYWYSPEIRGLWYDEAAVLRLHQCTTGVSDDLPFFSRNVKIINSIHSVENGGYTDIVSCCLNSPKYPKSLDDEVVSDVIYDAITRCYDNDGDSWEVDYVELFDVTKQYNKRRNLVQFMLSSEVLPLHAGCDLYSKMMEEWLEVEQVAGPAFGENPTIVDAAKFMDEFLDFANSIMLASYTGSGLFVASCPEQMIALEKWSRLFCDLTSEDRGVCYGYYPFIATWLEKQGRRKRPQAPMVLLDFIQTCAKLDFTQIQGLIIAMTNEADADHSVVTDWPEMSTK